MLLGFELHMELHILNRISNIQLIPPYLATLLLCSRYPHREPVTAQIPVVPASSQSSATSHGHPENPQASFRTTTSIPLSSNSAVPCTGHCHDQLKFKAEHEKEKDFCLFVCFYRILRFKPGMTSPVLNAKFFTFGKVRFSLWSA